jgi:hypothetical protein
MQGVPGVVMTAIGQVDTADVGGLAVDDDQLLVMAVVGVVRCCL